MMREEITYVADDGKVFHNREDCESYEYRNAVAEIRERVNEIAPEYDIVKGDFIAAILDNKSKMSKILRLAESEDLDSTDFI